MNEQLLKLTKLEFYTFDISLYLDTHPDDINALNEFNKSVRDTALARNEYEKTRSLNFYINKSPDRYTWIDEPWPWDVNFY